MCQTTFAGVLGFPIRHSLSPEIFSWISRETGVPLDYQKLEVSPDQLQTVSDSLKSIPQWLGWNVTLPHKVAMAGLVDTLSPEAAAIQAVNVVKMNQGKLEGYNTDVQGVLDTFRDTLRDRFPTHRDTLQEQNLSRHYRSALIIGTGGAALSVGYALGMEGASQVWIQSRSLDRAAQAAARLQAVFKKTEYHALAAGRSIGFKEPVDLYVHATPIGMADFPGEVPLPQEVTRGALAFDLIYRPEHTPFLEAARRKGLQTVGGLGMLIGQALATWEIWFGEIQNRDTLKIALKTHLQSILRGQIP